MSINGIETTHAGPGFTLASPPTSTPFVAHHQDSHQTELHRIPRTDLNCQTMIHSTRTAWRMTDLSNRRGARVPRQSVCTVDWQRIGRRARNSTGKLSAFQTSLYAERTHTSRRSPSSRVGSVCHGRSEPQPPLPTPGRDHNSRRWYRQGPHNALRSTTNCTVGTCLFTTRVIGTKAFAKCSLFWGPRAGFAPHPLSHDKCAAPLCATPETMRPKVEVPRK